MEVGTPRHFEWLKVIIGFIFIINAIDGILTVFWIFAGLAHEANPLMDHLVDRNPVLFITVKLSLVALGSWLLWRLRRIPVAVIGLFVVFFAYYLLLLYHAEAVARFVIHHFS